MASAIADGLISRKGEVSIAVCDPALQGAWGDRQAQVVDPETLFSQSRWLVWAVKPQVFKAEAWKLGFAGEGMISVMAGIPCSAIEGIFPETPVVRTMPNTPLLVGQGMVALCPGASAKDAHLDHVEGIFEGLGQTLRVREDQMDGVTAVSGSGPAYLFYLAEAIQERASQLGLEGPQALKLWSQTLRGAASMLEGGTPAAELRQQVTSSGGTTAAALEHFGEHQLGQIFSDGLQAAHTRSLELSR